MSTYDDTTSDGVMIAFLPTSSEWCKLELPHMTLVYAGLKSDLTANDFSSLVKDAASIALLARPFALTVMEVEVFGDIPSEKVNVLRFRATPELLALRRQVEGWNKSSHPFNPHATIGPASDPLPDYPPNVVGFDRLVVEWGSEQLTWWLNGRY